MFSIRCISSPPPHAAWCNGGLLCGLLLLVLPVSACINSGERADTQDALADDMEAVLRTQVLDTWYPRAADREHGGFLSDFDANWEATGPQDKLVVTQGRHTWTTARAARLFPENDSLYLSLATGGTTFLRDHMWDRKHGGFVQRVSRAGEPQTTSSGAVKEAHEQSYALYGLAAHTATGNEEALQLAKKEFHWIDRHAHDAEHGGYFQFLARDGSPFRNGYERTPPKGMNSMLHLLEAYTSLYRVWPDSVLERRLGETLSLLRDTLITDRNFLRRYADADWSSPTPQDLLPENFSSQDSVEAVRNLARVSFGHNLEAAYLMVDAAEVIGAEQDATRRVAKQLVDHALHHGWDEEVGGMYNGGYYESTKDSIVLTNTSKSWWVQAEALNALLLMMREFPDDERRYDDRFRKQWAYIKENLIDWERGGWYSTGLDVDSASEEASKGSAWKTTYHSARALMRGIQGLRSDDSNSFYE